MKNEKAFTLIELLVVISIVGLLSSIVLSVVGSVREKAKNSSTQAALRSIKNHAEIFSLDAPSGGEYDGFCADSKTQEMMDAVSVTSGKAANCVESPSGNKYTASAGKVAASSSVEKSYCVDSSGFIGETTISADAQTTAGECLDTTDDLALATDESCFTFSNGTITNYSSACTKSVSIPSIINDQSVTAIADSAFHQDGLTSLSIPNSVTSIGFGAFGYNSLTSVTIPDSVISIGNRSFQVNPITSAYVSDGVTYIGANVFYSTSLTSVSIKSGTTYHSSAFPPSCTVGSGCIVVRP